MKFDQIGYWSEVKLDIIREYASAYSTILSAQTNPRLYHVYIDAFAGAGVHLSKTTKELIPGSPLNALSIQRPFRDYHLIDLNGDKIDYIMQMVGQRRDIHPYKGDCNKILLSEVFPLVKYEDYRRGLCLLDPYGLHLNWEVVQTAGDMKSIEIFINFPIMDINRTAFWKNPDKVSSANIQRMNAFWGDDSWRSVGYSTTGNFFGAPEKEDNKTLAQAYMDRLKRVAGFSYVPEPVPMRNTKGAEVYYLFFASQKAVAANIIRNIFDKYRKRGAIYG